MTKLKNNSFFSSLIKNYFFFTMAMSVALVVIISLSYMIIVAMLEHYLEMNTQLEITETIVREAYFTVTPVWFKIVSIGIIILFILVYIGILIGFSKVLTSRVKKPLNKLNEGLQSIATKTNVEPISFKGDKEFVQICDSFNTMVNRLNKYEVENKKLQEEKQKIIADISHDLKTPITSIQGYSKALCDNLIPEDKKQSYLQLIYRKSEELNELINFFHEYSVVEREDYKMKTEKININEFLRKFFAYKYEQIEEEQFILDVDIPESKLFVNIDTLQFKRVLNNLINNSIKYNPINTTISIGVYEENNNCIIEIRDNGVGIQKNLQRNIFDPLVTGDDSRGSKHGTGLGLAITRCIVEKHKGNICLVSDEKENWSTIFKITLPKT
ncbi:MAG: HAMP domain-containing sensor histidine kinase [Terrisporobacter sp.]